MRRFIVSDLHGNGEVYDSIIAYLENISLTDEVELYINGDLIDRGLDSFRMFQDVIERVNGKGPIKIHYLGGNHELMMFQALSNRKPNKTISHFSDWMLNGGEYIEGELDSLENYEEKCEEFKTFAGSLKIYKRFDDYIAGNRLLLVHAQAPDDIKDDCDMKISDNNFSVFRAVWTRKENNDILLSLFDRIIRMKRVGKEGYLTIIGHTPVNNSKGFYYDKKENFINIDGGCSGYAIGEFNYDHVPLVEIEDNKLSFLIFNHNNQIINGYYFDGNVVKMDQDDLDKRRIYIDRKLDNNGIYKRKLIKELRDDIGN